MVGNGSHILTPNEFAMIRSSGMWMSHAQEWADEFNFAVVSKENHDWRDDGDLPMEQPRCLKGDCYQFSADVLGAGTAAAYASLGLLSPASTFLDATVL